MPFLCRVWVFSRSAPLQWVCCSRLAPFQYSVQPSQTKRSLLTTKTPPVVPWSLCSVTPRPVCWAGSSRVSSLISLFQHCTMFIVTRDKLCSHPSLPAAPHPSPRSASMPSSASAPPSYPRASPPAPSAHTPAPSIQRSPVPGYAPSLAAITEAQKLSKYAVSSLGFEDIPTAIKNLKEALRLLTEPK